MPAGPHCHQCKGMYASFREVFEHRARDHGDQVYRCPYCSYLNTSRQAILGGHQKTRHQGVKMALGQIKPVYWDEVTTSLGSSPGIALEEPRVEEAEKEEEKVTSETEYTRTETVRLIETAVSLLTRVTTVTTRYPGGAVTEKVVTEVFSKDAANPVVHTSQRPALKAGESSVGGPSAASGPSVVGQAGGSGVAGEQSPSRCTSTSCGSRGGRGSWVSRKGKNHRDEETSSEEEEER